MPPLPVIHEEDTASDTLSEPLMIHHRDGNSSDEDDQQQQQQQQEEEQQQCSLTEQPHCNKRRMCPIKRLLQRYVKYMSSALHKDRGLKFLSYSLVMMGALMERKKELAKGTQVCKKLSLDILWARYCLRFLDLPAAVEAAWMNSWSYGSPFTGQYSNIQSFLGRLVAWSMVGYYPTEHLAFAQWMVPGALVNKERNPRSAEQWSAISCRFWLLYIVTESMQCLLQWKEIKEAEEQEKQDNNNKNKEEPEGRLATLRWTKLQLLRNALFLLPCITWSLPQWDSKPLLSSKSVNMLMWLESVVCLYQ